MHKHIVKIFMLLLFTVSLNACGKGNHENVPKWHISLSVAEETAENSYVITWNTEPIKSNTGWFSVRNSNEYDITIHLSTAGEEERMLEISAGKLGVVNHIKEGASYQIGIHTDEDVNTPIEVAVYDGKDTDAEG